MARVAIAGGHSKAAPGAKGYLDEYAENRRIKDALLAEMRKRGHEATDCSNELSPSLVEMQKEVELANASNAEIFCAIHLNAYETTQAKRGVECWYWDGDAMGQKVAASMSAKLADLMGIPNRGAKATRDLYVIANTDMTAVLPEVCFVDSMGDTWAYQSVTTEAIASAMAEALEVGVGKVEAPEPEEPKADDELMEVLHEIQDSIDNIEADIAEFRAVLDMIRKC